jgi:hypothetical protein
MADLRNNIRANTEAGVVLGLVGAVNKFLVYGMPVIYDAVSALGRWGEPVFALALGFVLDFVDQRAQFLERMRIPSRFYIYGLYRLVDEALGMVQGRGFAHIKSDGSIATDPSDAISAVYMQKGDSVVAVKTGSRTVAIGARRYVAVGAKRVYYFEAPYELPAA